MSVEAEEQLLKHQVTDYCAHTTHGISNQYKHARWQGEPRGSRMCCRLTTSHPRSITEGGPRAEFMVKINRDVHAVSTSMAVAG